MLMSLEHVMSPSTISRHQNKSAIQIFFLAFFPLILKQSIKYYIETLLL